MKDNILLEDDIEGTTSRPMDFAKVVFLQVDRINKAMTEQQGNFMAGIDALEVDLAFFSENDPEFKADLEEIEKQAKDWLRRRKRYVAGEETDQTMTLAYARARELMKAIMRLIGRKGFYPEMQGHFKGKA